MEKHIVYDESLTKADRIILKTLATDIENHPQVGREATDIRKSQGLNHQRDRDQVPDCEKTRQALGRKNINAKLINQIVSDEDERSLSYLNGMNDPTSPDFEPSVFQGTDYCDMDWKRPFNQYVLRHYIRIAKSIVRVDIDVIMLTHIILYFSTSVPSAIYLFFGSFNWIHGILHFSMQASYAGAYTLMMHQHIHMRGVLNKRFALFDQCFPYITDPLMGHTWNSYFNHHVKHHHIEGNGPGDLSSTMDYQRDSVLHFLHYVGKFLALVWLELPLYFVSKKRYGLAVKTFFWEVGTYVMFYFAYKFNPQATICVYLLPFCLMRLGLMIGNWGQHAFVDNEEPDSDYRSSITLIDVQSNRYSFNDGYHTSHHLNPLRHWREHPNSFLKSRHVYASEGALVFHNIDYFMMTIRLLMKDYEHLAKCLVPIGEEQLGWTLEERIAHLKSRTRRFTAEEMKLKYN